eukprot:m.166140 g.166140  ORF g.166140 m.166140 type:complete len:686 (+) comp31420_c0_seq2:70-2127(+)
MENEQERKRLKMAEQDSITIQILCTNDLHSKMDGVRLPDGKAVGGLARRADEIFRMRKQVGVDATLVFDAGDHFTGSEFFQFLQGEVEMKTLDVLGYNATALGNHDFDADSETTSGLPLFQQLAAEHCPDVKLICANVVNAADNTLVLIPHAIFEPVPGVKVGVTAVIGAGAWSVTPMPSRKQYRYTDFVAAAQREATILKQKGCDVLVCLSHTGFTRGDKELAALEIFDVVFSGHEHFYESKNTLQPHSASVSDTNMYTTQGSGMTERARLGLVSQGIADGGGVAWVQFQLNRNSKKTAWDIARHTSGLNLLDSPISEPSQDPEVAHVQWLLMEWRKRFTLKSQQVVGACVNIPQPDRNRIQAYLRDDQQSAVAFAVREAIVSRLRSKKLTVLTSTNSQSNIINVGVTTRTCDGDDIATHNNIADNSNHNHSENNNKIIKKDHNNEIRKNIPTDTHNKHQNDFYNTTGTPTTATTTAATITTPTTATTPTATTTTPTHHVLTTALANGTHNTPIIVIGNRNGLQSRFDLKAGAMMERDLLNFLPFTATRHLYGEMSGKLIIAIVQHNVSFLFKSNFLYMLGVTYTLHWRTGGVVTTSSIPHDLDQDGFAESIVVGDVRVGDNPIAETQWYPVITKDYELDTVIANLPNVDSGFRNRVDFGHHSSLYHLVKESMRDGVVLGSHLS